MTKSTIGVDISKDCFDAHRLPDGGAKQFRNTKAGCCSFIKWAGPDVERIVYEPTGPYHRRFEGACAKAGLALCKVNPKNARRFAEATGLDLVALQIPVAQGGELRFAQDDVTFNGYAIEARLYAENATEDFLPATGPIDLKRPAEGDSKRIDSGIATGGEVSSFYDPMIAKIIAQRATRDEAR